MKQKIQGKPLLFWLTVQGLAFLELHPAAPI